MSLPVDADFVCRTCLSYNKTMFCIYNTNVLGQFESKICDMIQEFATVQVSEEDGLPDKICYRCAEDLTKGFMFRRLCIKSDITLRELLLTNRTGRKAICEEFDIQADVEFVELPNVFKHKMTDDGNKQSSDDDASSIKEIHENEEKDDNLSGVDEKFCTENFIQLRNRKLIHNTELPTCNVCDKSFSNTTGLKRHGLIHTGERPHLCNLCGKNFIQQAHLMLHLTTHDASKQHKCEDCNKSFARKSHLTMHKRTHNGERPFECSVCNKRFKSSSERRSHLNVHSDGGTQECNVCRKKFSTVGSLRIHLRTHTGEKPFGCGKCEKSFAEKPKLTIHMRTHTGERPYLCGVCGRGFRQYSALSTHKKTVHKVATARRITK